MNNSNTYWERNKESLQKQEIDIENCLLKKTI